MLYQDDIIKMWRVKHAYNLWRNVKFSHFIVKLLPELPQDGFAQCTTTRFEEEIGHHIRVFQGFRVMAMARKAYKAPDR